MEKEKKEFPPPPGLSPESAVLWSEIVPRRGRSPERLALIRFALENLDGSRKLWRQIMADGLTFETEGSKMTRAHPLLPMHKVLSGNFAKAWHVLEFDRYHPLDQHRIS